MFKFLNTLVAKLKTTMLGIISKTTLFLSGVVTITCASIQKIKVSLLGLPKAVFSFILNIGDIIKKGILLIGSYLNTLVTFLLELPFNLIMSNPLFDLKTNLMIYFYINYILKIIQEALLNFVKVGLVISGQLSLIMNRTPHLLALATVAVILPEYLNMTTTRELPYDLIPIIGKGFTGWRSYYFFHYSEVMGDLIDTLLALENDPNQYPPIKVIITNKFYWDPTSVNYAELKPNTIIYIIYDHSPHIEPEDVFPTFVAMVGIAACVFFFGRPFG